MYPVGNSKDLWNIMQSFTMTFSKALQKKKKLIKRRKWGQNSFIILDFYWLGVRGIIEDLLSGGLGKESLSKIYMHLIYVFTSSNRHQNHRSVGWVPCFICGSMKRDWSIFRSFSVHFTFSSLRRWCDLPGWSIWEESSGLTHRRAVSLFLCGPDCPQK